MGSGFRWKQTNYSAAVPTTVSLQSLWWQPCRFLQQVSNCDHCNTPQRTNSWLLKTVGTATTRRSNELSSIFASHNSACVVWKTRERTNPSSMITCTTFQQPMIVHSPVHSSCCRLTNSSSSGHILFFVEEEDVASLLVAKTTKYKKSNPTVLPHLILSCNPAQQSIIVSYFVFPFLVNSYHHFKSRLSALTKNEWIVQ